MATLSINTDNLAEVRAGRTISDFANEVGVDTGTMSRLISGKSKPGDRTIAALLTTYPYPFEHFFTVTDAA